MVRLSTSFAAAATALVALLPVVSAEASAGTVKYTWEKKHLTSQDDFGRAERLRRAMQKRQNVVNAELSSALLFYIINITVGTPPQPLSLILDTGSSDIWFPASDSSYCQRLPENCDLDNAFDQTASSTFSELPNLPDFQISYVDGSETDGQYFTDVLGIGSTQVTNMTMAYAETFDRPIGIMGIGFREGESSNFIRNPFTYPNIVDQLKAQGHINTLSYSLWLDDPDADTGSILFGGVDRAKYTGDLVTLPIQLDSTSESYSSLSVAWTGLRLTGSGNDIDYSPASAEAVVLDSGTSLTYLPNSIADNIYNALGVNPTSRGYNLLPCSLRNDDLSFEFEFGGSGGAKIVVGISELLLSLVDSSDRPFTYQGVEYCDFGIQPAGDYPVLFGDTFLRSAYIVYDLENRNIGLAQTNFNANPDTQEVEAFSSGGGIPGSTQTATGVSADQTFTGRPPVATNNLPNADVTGPLRSPTIPISSGTTSPTSTGNAAPHAVSVDTTIFPFLAVTFGAFIFGGMLM